MEHVEDKLDHFSKMILQSATSKRNEKIEAVEKEKQKVLEKKELEFLEEAYHQIQDYLRKLRKKKNEIISRATMDGRRKLLNKREKIVKEIFQEVEEEILQFTKTPEYYAYLVESIKKNQQLINDEDVTIFISPTDEQYLEELNKKFQNKVMVDEKEQDMLGGCKIVSKTKNIVVNDSLRQKLNQQRKQFLHDSKLEIE